MKKQHIEMIECPGCFGTNLLLEDSGKEQQVLLCPSCKRDYPVSGPMTDLFPEIAENPSLAQKAMEFPPISAIYESPFWRKNPFLPFVTGISFDEELSCILDVLPKSNALVLDIACGTGIYTRPLATRMDAGAVFGLDLSLPMLKSAGKRAEKEEIENLFFIRANALSLPFGKETFDAVNCCAALHLFPEPETVIRGVFRVLKPGGCFTVACVRMVDNPLFRRWAKTMKTISGIASFEKESLFRQFLNTGFSAVDILHSGPAWLMVCAKKDSPSDKPV